MGKVFPNQSKFNDYEGKYSYPNWNEAANRGYYGDIRDVEMLVEGNFYCFMNHLLEFKPHPETVHPWIPINSRYVNGL